jgi:drug/metabolite transporter (DMT)-like permease
MAGLIGAMLFAVLGATVASYLLNVWAIKRTQASHVALFIFLQPLVAAALGVIALGEQITPRLLIALALVFAALALRDGNAPATPPAGDRVETAA